MSASAPSGAGRRERSASVAARRSEEPACTPTVLAQATRICAVAGLFGLQVGANPPPTSRKPPIRKVGGMTAAARTIARGLFEACVHVARRLSLVLFRGAGALSRRDARTGSGAAVAGAGGADPDGPRPARRNGPRLGD